MAYNYALREKLTKELKAENEKRAKSSDLRSRTVARNRGLADQDESYAPAGVSREVWDALRAGTYRSAVDNKEERAPQSRPTKSVFGAVMDGSYTDNRMKAEQKRDAQASAKQDLRARTTAMNRARQAKNPSYAPAGMTAENYYTAIRSSKDIEKNWDRWVALAGLTRTPTEAERNEMKLASKALYGDFGERMRISFYGTNEERARLRRYDMLRTILDNKSSALSALQAGLADSIPGVGWGMRKIQDLTRPDANDPHYTAQFGEGLTKVLAGNDALADAKNANAGAHTVGGIAGGLLSLNAAGATAGKAVEGAKWFGKLAKPAQRAIKSGITFGTERGLQALDDVQTKEQWERSEERNAQEYAARGMAYEKQPYSAWQQAGNVLREAGIGAVGGAAGSALGGIVGNQAKRFLVRKQLQTPFAEVVRNALEGTAFAAGDIGATYFLYPEGSRPTKEQIVQDLTLGFLFSAVTSGLDARRTTKANKAVLDRGVAEMKAKYQATLDSKLSNAQKATALEKIQRYNDDIRKAIASNYYAGQQGYVDDILLGLDAIDEQLSRMKGKSGQAAGNGMALVPENAAQNIQTGKMIGGTAQKLPPVVQNNPVKQALANEKTNPGTAVEKPGFDDAPFDYEDVTAYKKDAAHQKANENPPPNVRNESDVTASSPTIPQQTPVAKTQGQSRADLEQARPAIAQYAKQSGLSVQWYSDAGRPDKADTNGFYENGTIYINENAENPYMEVFKHELFHALSGRDKQAVIDFFRKNVNENTQTFMDYKMRTMQAQRRKNLRYSDADFWEEYTAQNAEFLLDESYIERISQTDRSLAQRILDWIKRTLARIKSVFSAPKDYNADVASHESGRVGGLTDAQLQQAQRLYEKALHGAREAESGTRYSIETLPDGKRYVQADRQAITGNDPKQWAKQVERYINDKIRQGKDVTVYGADGDPLTITRDTAGKARFRNYITYSDGSKRRMNNQEYGAKLRAESHIDEASAVSNRGNRIVPDTKNHNFAKDGFNYRTAYYRDLDGTYYRLTISVGKNGNINSVYNIGKIKEAPFPDVAQRPDSNAVKGGTSNITIPQDSATVNTSIRENLQNDTAKKSLKHSKFYDSIQKADTVAEEVKSGARDAEQAYYYRQIGNVETMKKAVSEVEKDPARAGMRFMGLGDGATTDDIAKGFVLLKEYQDAGDYESAVDIARKLSEIGTKQGRQLQIYSVLGRMTPEGMLRFATSELEKVKALVEKKQGQKWMEKNKKRFELTNEEAKQITDRMERMQAMPDGRDKAVMLAEVQKIVQSKMPSTKGSKLSTLQRISLLLNPKTVISRNALSNLLMNPIYAVSDFVASGADKLAGMKTGLRTVSNPSYGSQIRGMKKGAFESFDDFRRAVNTRDIQANRYEISNKLGSGPAFKGKNPLSKAIAFLDRTTGFLLDVGDRPFFEGYFLESLNGQMKANKTDAPTADMIDIATQTALEKTWQDDNVITESAARMKKALNFKQDFGLGNIIVPFVKTPSNIAKAIVDFSPAGFAKAVTVDAFNFTKAVKNGTVTAQMQNKFAKNIGKGAAGILLYAAGLALAANGITTGSDDEKDKDIRNFKRNILGINPYSIKIGDQTFTYDWAQPVGAILSTTADLQRNKIDMGNAADIITDALVAGGSTLFEQSMLSGLSELFGGYDGFPLALANAVLDMPSQFVPTLSKQVAEMADPYARRTATGGLVDKAANKVLARVPGATKKLEPVVDVLGRDVKRYGGKNNLFNVFLNPANVNLANPTAETKEIWRIYEETGDADIFPKVAPNSFTDNNTSYALTPKEQTQFQRTMGQETSQELRRLMSSSRYKNGTDADKAALVKKVIEAAYNKAKAELVQNRGGTPSKKLKKVVGE